MFSLKGILSGLVLCSLDCTCLVTNVLAEAAGNDAPCHHMAMEVGSDKQPTENCCQEKMEAWKEAVEQEKDDTPDKVPVTITTRYWEQVTLPTTPTNIWARPSDKSQPAHISSWNTIRLIV